MFSYYEDERVSEKCIALIKNPFDRNISEHLKELCRFKTRAADEFWRDCLSEDNGCLPYIMMCRSNEVSDHAAKKLDSFVSRLLEGGMSRHDMANEAYFLLHACLFKESDRLIDVYRRIAANYSLINKYNINWSGGFISGSSQPEFLAERYECEEEAGCESEFFAFLTDVLILTMANAVTLDKDEETFTEKIVRLYEDYPDVYASVGFFAHFIKDTGNAYEKFKHLTDDPVDYPALMWVLDGLFYSDAAYRQGSPAAFTGPENSETHFTLPIKKLDISWYRFYCEKIIEDAENASVNDPYFGMSFCRKFSSNLFRLINLSDAEAFRLCGQYFRRSAVIAGNTVDFAGLSVCGAVHSSDELAAVSLEIAERICSGRQRYCFDGLFNVFSRMEHEETAEAVKKTAEYIAENERSERFAKQRDIFLGKARDFINGNDRAFLHNNDRSADLL